MESSNKRFADQLHAAMSIMESNETVKETVNENFSTDELVVEYLSSFFGQDLTESTEDISEDDLLEAVEALNSLCAIVNEYFGLEESSPPTRSTLNMKPTPLSKPRKPDKVTPDKGLSPDARELRATGGLSTAIVGRRGPDGRPLDQSAGGISPRHAKAQGELVQAGEIPPSTSPARSQRSRLGIGQSG